MPRATCLGEILSRVSDRAWLIVLTRRPGRRSARAADAAPSSCNRSTARPRWSSCSPRPDRIRPAPRRLGSTCRPRRRKPAVRDRARRRGRANTARPTRSRTRSKASSRRKSTRCPHETGSCSARASVLGAVVDVDLLAEALEDDGIRDPIRWQPLEDFLVPDDTDDAIPPRDPPRRRVRGVALPRRREMHARAARAIRHRFADQTDSVAGLLSTHYSARRRPRSGVGILGQGRRRSTTQVCQRRGGRVLHPRARRSPYAHRRRCPHRRDRRRIVGGCPRPHDAVRKRPDVRTRSRANTSRPVRPHARSCSARMGACSSARAVIRRRCGHIPRAQGDRTHDSTQPNDPCRNLRFVRVGAVLAGSRPRSGRVGEGNRGRREGRRQAGLAHALRLIEVCLEELGDADS